jgi:CRISPR-associated protein Cmr2
MARTYCFSFTLGPVQSAIRQARSVRDLWTGSYLISWLTARGAAAALDAGAGFRDPQWAESPLVQVQRKQPANGLRAEALRRSGLPNTFSFTFETDDGAAADKLAETVRRAVFQEWHRIADAVHAALAKAGLPRGWDSGWQDQIRGVWTVRVDHLETGPGLADSARALGCKDAELLADPERLAGELLARAGAAAKLARPIRPHGAPGDTRPKCSLTGEDAQMGPPEYSLKDQQDFWSGPMAEAVKQAGERLRAGERFGAPALVKRLAWACALARRLHQEPEELRTTDTATLAAGPWIAGLRGLDTPIPDEHAYLHEWAREQCGSWSGQWLHRAEDPDEPAPKAIAEEIRKARTAQGTPPVYLAVLMMDGDRMGERLRVCGRDGLAEFTGKLARFSGTEVPAIIRDYLHGRDGLQFNQPVYAGGDDVLALLPMWMPKPDGRQLHQSAVGLAHALARSFGALGLPGGSEPATMSAGIAVVHFKTDLREALDAARDAEADAKRAGRNRLVLSVMRRSGEHTQAVLPWDHVSLFDKLVAAFVGGASDRWAYRLRQTLDQLTTAVDRDRRPHFGSFVDLLDAECARAIGHAEVAIKDAEVLKQLFNDAWSTFSFRGSTNGAHTIDAQRNALTLIQSASFLARGREEAR